MKTPTNAASQIEEQVGTWRGAIRITEAHPEMVICGPPTGRVEVHFEDDGDADDGVFQATFDAGGQLIADSIGWIDHRPEPRQGENR